QILHCDLDVEDWMLDVGCSAFPTPSPIAHTQNPLLQHHFDLHPSMTASDAYTLLPHLIDSPSAPGQKLIASGLIDPNSPLWGQTPCRYLKQDFQHPRIPPEA